MFHVLILQLLTALVEFNRLTMVAEAKWIAQTLAAHAAALTAAC